MSLEKRNNTNREFRSLQNSFDQWEAGTPSADVWENLEADLAVSAVWDRLDETLEANGSAADKVLIESYEYWSPNNSGDGWSKLEEQLSRERVWTRLNTTLSYPITTTIPWMKMAAASLIFVFTAFYTDYVVNGVREKNNAMVFNLVGSQTEPEKQRDLIAESTAASGETDLFTDRKVMKQAIAGNRAKNNTLVSAENPLVNPELNDNKGEDTPLKLAHLAQNNPQDQTKGSASQKSNPVNWEDLASLNELDRKEISFVPGTIEDFTFLPYKSPFRPKFSVLVGGQFSFINEKNRSAFSSSIPSMGIAADLQYHTYLGKVRFTQGLGFSQYAQSNGSYINGRYTSSNQKLNTIHLISSVGYTFKGVTVYGGVSLNRLLNGYEESRTTITNVYNSNQLQLGATAGVDYHFAPFKNKTALGLGMQYQFVSRLKSGNAVFNDIQGVKLQIKYSF